jgi:hypothetical protein
MSSPRASFSFLSFFLSFLLFDRAAGFADSNAVGF